MTYHLDSEIRKIESPIVLCVDGRELLFSNGQELCDRSFDVKYTVRSVSAKESKIVIVLQEGNVFPDPTGVRCADMGIAD